MAEATVDNLDIQIKASSSEAVTALTKLSGQLAELSAKLGQVSAQLNKQSKSAAASTSATRKVTNETRKLHTAASKAADGGLKKLIRAFGRIMLYRAMRTIIKNLTAGIKEGITNLKEYSATVGTDFAPAVDNLKQHVLMLKNAFATALRPVIEALIPVIIKLVDWLSKAADFIAQVVSLLTGKVDANGRYTKAVLSDLQESNAEAKELKRSLMGFDEINRLDGDSGSSSSQKSGGLMFEQAEVSDKAKQWAEKLQKIIDKIKEIRDKIKEIIDKNPWIKEFAGYFLGAWAGAKLLLGVLGLVFGMVKKILNPWMLILAYIVASALYGDKMKEWLEGVKKKWDSFADGLKTDNVLFNGFITVIKDLIDGILEGIGLISDAIYKFVHGDTEGAIADLKELGWGIVRFILTIIIDLWNIIAGVLEDVAYLFQKAWTWVHNKVFAPAVNAIFTWLLNAKIWLHNAWLDIEIGIVKAWRWIWSFLKEKFGDIINSINDLIAWMNKVFGTDIDPIEFDTNTTNLDAKIEELEKMKLDPLTETVEIIGQWEEPEKLKLHIDTSAVDWAMTQLGYKAQGVLNKLSQITTTWTSSSGHLKKEWNIEYASGGFPAVGSMFIAGEAGAEWVGNIGGRTGVMNTEQMASAMYSAMSAALANNPQGGGDIYLDGEVIYRNTMRRNNNHVRATGRSAFLT